VLAVVGYVAVTALQVWWAEGWDDRGTADAAVVLGAAQYNGRPSPVFAARLDHAYELYAAKRVPKVVVTGGSKAGDRFTEAYSGLKYLQGKGVPGADVIVVSNGSSTWESLAAAARVFRKEGIAHVLFISDPYHSYRVLSIADEVGIDGAVSPARSGTRSSTAALARETGLVAVGRVIGYRRLVNLVEAPS
jgi:vancomycin permeability regulator SanA